jgi:5'-nucleotidase
MPVKPDFVLSGINHGQNMGEDVLYSGTVAAAMEGLALGIRSIAISYAGRDFFADSSRLEELVQVLVPLLTHITGLSDLPADTLLNINIPPVRPADINGVKLTRLGRRVYSNSIRPMEDPWGRPIYWIGGGEVTWAGDDRSDFQAIRDGYVSVTPLHLDLTHHARFDEAEVWWRTP